MNATKRGKSLKSLIGDPSWFELLICGVGDYCPQRIPPEERAAVLKSRDAAARKLALTNVAYQGSLAQLGRASSPFDRDWFAFRAWKWLPALRERINVAIDDNDFDFFVSLGKSADKLKKQPANQVEHGDPLGSFLVRHWVSSLDFDRQRSGAVPSFCLFTEKVLAEVCNDALKRGQDSAAAQASRNVKKRDGLEVSSMLIESKVKHLGLRRARSFKLSYYGYRRGLLHVGERVDLLKKAGVSDVH